MKTNYFELNDGDLEAAVKDLSADLTEALAGKPINIGATANNEIVEISNLTMNPNKHLDMLITVKFTDGNLKKYCYLTAASSHFISIPDDETSEIITNAFIEIDKLDEKFKERDHEEFLARQAAYEEKVNARKLEAHNKRMEEKRKSQKASALRMVERLSSIKPEEVNDFYLCLGWVAKHAKNIDARMPDFLEQWFVSEFGDVERHVSDSTKLTTGGFISQWALSIKIILDTNEGIPASLMEMLSEENKKTKSIARTNYVFTLCKDYGFKFGKEQNLDDILAHVPDDMLESFNLGMSM